MPEEAQLGAVAASATLSKRNLTLGVHFSEA